MADVTVLYFAATRDVVGRSEDRMTLPDAVTTVADFRAHLERAVPALEGRLGSVRIARNEEFASDGDPVCGGDVLALVPPVAGG